MSSASLWNVSFWWGRARCPTRARRWPTGSVGCPGCRLRNLPPRQVRAVPRQPRPASHGECTGMEIVVRTRAGSLRLEGKEEGDGTIQTLAA